MSSEFGNLLRVSVFGQSHGQAVGVLLDGLPAGETIDLVELQMFLNRRRPGNNPLSTARMETDIPRFLSGVTFPDALSGVTFSDADASPGAVVTCGAPLLAVLENRDTHSADYDAVRNPPRPGHADYTAWVKWRGNADMRGGGHFSARLTAPLCVAGGIAKQILARRNIHVGAHLYSVGMEWDQRFPLYPDAEIFATLAGKTFPVLNEEAGERMRTVIQEAKEDGDSVGGVVECAAVGMPAGLGEPMFGGVENRLAAALFGIPSVKGVEFGEGFEATLMRGSENNDEFVSENGRIVTKSNHSGGILGGITNGMPVLVRAGFKPTPSIAKLQHTVNLSDGAPAEISVSGRHDPCTAFRAVPIVEAVTALVLLDMLLEGNHGILRETL